MTSQDAIQAQRDRVGSRLFRLAVQWSRKLPETNAERIHAIKAVKQRKAVDGSASARKAEPILVALAEMLSLSRRQRILLRFASRLGKPVDEVLASRAGGRLRSRIFSATPSAQPPAHQRLDQHRRYFISEAMHACLTWYVRESDPSIVWVDNLSDCRAQLSLTRGWIQYSRRFGSRPGITDAKYSIRAIAACPVPRSLHGLLTLGAVPAPDLAMDGEAVFAAAWAAPTRTDVETTHGYIVGRHIGRKMSYAHGKTVGAARSVLSRRLNEARATDWHATILKHLEAGRIDGYECHVELRDARRAGLCDPGIRAWFARHFPDRDIATGATVAEIIAINDLKAYALAACLSAIRRHGLATRKTRPKKAA